ncbi:MAG TPA: DUF6668 family protein [Streptosporangiaceae bacterium]|nr:DUF6668 family protein [Streptosporangiaceae bacterium]
MTTTRSGHKGGPTVYLAERLLGLRNVKPPVSERDNRTHAWLDAPAARRDFSTLDGPVPVSVVGTHGGAGTSTVARLLRAADAGRHWPTPADEGFPLRVILTARTNAAGLMVASQALAGYCANAHAGTYLAGFVLVPDTPGHLPRPLARRITILSSATMVYRLPWVREWRLSEVTLNPEAAPRIAEGLRRFAERAALATTPVLHEPEHT